MCRISCARRVKKFKAKAWNLIITLFMIRRRRTRRIDPKTPQVRHSDEMKYIKKYTIFLSKSQFLLASDNYYWMFMNRRIFSSPFSRLSQQEKKLWIYWNDSRDWKIFLSTAVRKYWNDYWFCPFWKTFFFSTK